MSRTQIDIMSFKKKISKGKALKVNMIQKSKYYP